MKKWICLILVVLLLMSMSVTAFAAPDPVSDMAGLLTAEQDMELTALLIEQGTRTLCVVTVESLDGQNVEDYAEDWAEKSGVGVLFLISMAERKWCITSSGEYEAVIDGYVIDQISEACVPYLRADDYYGAFTVFAEECSYYLDGYVPGEATNTDLEGEGMGGFGRFVICLVIGLAAGGITAGIMAGLNKSVRPRNSAAEYVRSGSMQVNVSRDIYLYHHITRTPKPQSNSSSGGGGSRSTRSGSF